MTHDRTAKSRKSLVNLPTPDSVEIRTKSEFLRQSRVSGDTSMVQLDTILYWDEY